MQIAQSSNYKPPTIPTQGLNKTIRRYDKGSTFEKTPQAMSSKKKSADELKAEIDALKEQIKLKSRQLREEDKKKDARRKFILGELLQEWVKTGKIKEADLKTALSAFLTREEDRILFDLKAEPATVQPPTPPPTDNAKDKKPETEAAPAPKKTTKTKPPTAGASRSQKTDTKQSAKPLKEINQDHLAKEFEM
ncbi:hypothetical protein HW132_32160 [Brasilonema sp. CT11]|nr:hypothetical protein [Brasilonema sp. CT11]